MKIIKLTLLLFSILIFFLSCSDDLGYSLVNVNPPYQLDRRTPPAIFSYNVTDESSGKMISWFIDKNGNVKKVEGAFTSIAHQSDFDLRTLQSIDIKSIETAFLIDQEQLYNNYNSLKGIDTVSNQSMSDIHPEITIYGYFYDPHPEHYEVDGHCAIPTDSMLFEYRLLQYSVDNNIIFDEKYLKITNWINALNLEEN